MADLLNQDDEQQKPDVKAYLAKKYNLAGDYQRAMDDTSELDAAKAKSDRMNMGAEIGGALDLAFGGGLSQDHYAGMTKRADQTVKDAQASRRQRIEDTTQLGKTQLEDDKATRDSQQYADENDPSSDASKSLRSFIQQVSPKLGQGPEFEKASYAQLSKVYPQLITAHEAAEARKAAARENSANRSIQRDAMANDRADRLNRLEANDLDNKTTKYSAALEKSGIPSAVAAVNDVDHLMPAKGDLPGFGRVVGAMPDMLVSDAGKDLRQAVSSLFNITLHDRSGAAVTDPELKRLKDEFGAGTWKTGDQLRKGVAQYKRRLAEVARNQMAGADEGARQEYVKRGGNDFGSIMQGWQAGAPEQTAAADQPAAGKQVVRRQINKKTGQVKLTYSDGSEEIQDGKQYAGQ